MKISPVQLHHDSINIHVRKNLQLELPIKSACCMEGSGSSRDFCMLPNPFSDPPLDARTDSGRDRISGEVWSGQQERITDNLDF